MNRLRRGKRSIPVPCKHRHRLIRIGGTAAGRGQIELAIAIEISCDDLRSARSRVHRDARGKRAVAIAEQHRNQVAIVVGYSQIRLAIAIEVSQRNVFYRYRDGKIGGGGKRSVSVAKQNAHHGVIIVHDNQVGDPVSIEVCSQQLACIGTNGGKWNLYRRLKGPVTRSQKDGDCVRGVHRDSQIWDPVSVEVADDHRAGSWSGIGRRWCFRVGSICVAQIDLHRIFIHHQIGNAVSVKVGHKFGPGPT